MASLGGSVHGGGSVNPFGEGIPSDAGSRLSGSHSSGFGGHTYSTRGANPHPVHLEGSGQGQGQGMGATLAEHRARLMEPHHEDAFSTARDVIVSDRHYGEIGEEYQARKDAALTAISVGHSYPKALLYSFFHAGAALAVGKGPVHNIMVDHGLSKEDAIKQYFKDKCGDDPSQYPAACLDAFEKGGEIAASMPDFCLEKKGEEIGIEARLAEIEQNIRAQWATDERSMPDTTSFGSTASAADMGQPYAAFGAEADAGSTLSDEEALSLAMARSLEDVETEEENPALQHQLESKARDFKELLSVGMTATEVMQMLDDSIDDIAEELGIVDETRKKDAHQFLMDQISGKK